MGLKRRAVVIYLKTWRRFRPPRQVFTTTNLLRELGVDTVIDVGANRGQYGRLMRRGGFTGRILSCEPLADAFARLQEEIGSDPTWSAERVAVGAEPGEQAIHVSGNSVSSSFLPMGDDHVLLAPRSAYVREETVPVTTLAALVEEHGIDPARAFLKADVQGYEPAVLDGAGDRLREFAVVQLETSLVELYDGQQLFPELLARLTDAGFVLWSWFPGWVDKPSGRLLWGDGLFVRGDLAAGRGISSPRH